MAAVASYLADTSALARIRHPVVATVLRPLIEAGLVGTCGLVEFELGWATRSGEEFDQVRTDRDACSGVSSQPKPHSRHGSPYKLAPHCSMPAHLTETEPHTGEVERAMSSSGTRVSDGWGCCGTSGPEVPALRR